MSYKMKPDDLAIAVGGISAPMWLPILNQWVALVVGVLSITYLAIKIYKATRKQKL
tara:strand:- start:1974 stop:2141 length:168 start_codon:yes stop_codon:yes gene_type:complete